MKSILTLALTFFITSLFAAYPPRDARGQNVAVKEMEHELENAQVQIRLFEERMKIQENIVDALRDQIQELRSSQKEQVNSSEQHLEKKMRALEASVKALMQDVKTLQTAVNDTHKQLQAQQKDMGHLQSAMKSIVGAFHEGETGTYKVRPGDSLEKIARHLGISIKQLKEMNNLSSDKIMTGQTLQVPKRT